MVKEIFVSFKWDADELGLQQACLPYRLPKPGPSYDTFVTVYAFIVLGEK